METLTVPPQLKQYTLSNPRSQHSSNSVLDFLFFFIFLTSHTVSLISPLLADIMESQPQSSDPVYSCFFSVLLQRSQQRNVLWEKSGILSVLLWVSRQRTGPPDRDLISRRWRAPIKVLSFFLRTTSKAAVSLYPPLHACTVDTWADGHRHKTSVSSLIIAFFLHCKEHNCSIGSKLLVIMSRVWLRRRIIRFGCARLANHRDI